MDDEERVVGVTDFLLELRSEEIPARMQAKARDDLARLFAAELAKAGLHATTTQTYATPRRLALIARGLPEATAAVSEEVKGPRVAAPPQALDGFLRKTGLTRDQLTERDGVLFAITEKPGRATTDLLAEAIPAVIRAFPWPKSMRWGAASLSTDSLRWVRPLHGIVALFGEDIVPVEIAGVTSGAATLGHRFHHPGAITIGSAGDYGEKLRACHVIVDEAEREALIRDRAAALAAEAGLALVEDEGLVAENAGLTEWPVPLLGRFDAAFLDVPPEVIQLTARVNQKYFVCRDGEGKLANAFICTANIAAPDGGAKIVEGNRKVLAARLADARFFYEQDAKVRLEDHAKKLERIVFHEKLGTVADKVERVAKLARWLVEEGIVGAAVGPNPTQGAIHPASDSHHPREGGGPVSVPSATELNANQQQPPQLDPRLRGGSEERAGGEGSRADLANLADRAAQLAKADLVTGMVGEFPELQGVMGGYYAAAQGEDPRVAAAIRDHYKPVGQGDEVPTAPVTVAVSLADKLDHFSSLIWIGDRPSGSGDPFAIRRAALSVLRMIQALDLRFDWFEVAAEAINNLLAQTAKRYALYRLFERDDQTVEMTNYDPESDDFVDSWYIRAGAQPGPMDIGFAEVRGVAEPGMSSVPEYLSFQKDTRRILIDRLKVQQREAGVRHDLIDAVFALGGEDDLVRLLARVRALQAFMATEDGANLLTGYRRAANILKKEGYSLSPSGERVPSEAKGGEGESDPASVPLSLPQPAAAPSLFPEGERENPLSYTPEPAEGALIAALDAAAPLAAEAVAKEDFEGAMAALASLRAPIDAFFETVTVNDPDPAKRSARLALLARMRDAVHAVADFSRIEG